MKSSETLYIGGDIQIDMNGTYTHIFGGGYSEFKPEVNNPDSIKYYYYTKDHLGRSTSREGGAFLLYQAALRFDYIAKRRKNIRNVLTQNDNGTMTELLHNRSLSPSFVYINKV